MSVACLHHVGQGMIGWDRTCLGVRIELSSLVADRRQGGAQVRGVRGREWDPARVRQEWDAAPLFPDGAQRGEAPSGATPCIHAWEVACLVQEGWGRAARAPSGVTPCSKQQC